MWDFLRNLFYFGKYKTNSKAVIISCFFNPQNNPYRLVAFHHWYKSIKHLNHRVIECLIGPDAKPQLPQTPYISSIRTSSLLWHKEALLNKIVRELPPEFKYVFFVDADVIFKNLNWLRQGVEILQHYRLVQPFSHCVHLSRNQLTPDFDVNAARAMIATEKHARMWRSFGYCDTLGKSNNKTYDAHGHTGFAWGTHRWVLEQAPLFERALTGSADHLLAHAAVGHFSHPCIEQGFGDNLDEARAWMQKFHSAVRNSIWYVPGDLYHIWHGGLMERRYLRRLKEFTKDVKKIQEKDANGLYTTPDDAFMRKYFRGREIGRLRRSDYVELQDAGFDIGLDFAEEMGYALADVIQMFGNSSSGEEHEPEQQSEPEQSVPETQEVPVPDSMPEPIPAPEPAPEQQSGPEDQESTPDECCQPEENQTEEWSGS